MRQINAIISIRSNKTGLVTGCGIYELESATLFICNERVDSSSPRLHPHLATLNLGRWRIFKKVGINLAGTIAILEADFFYLSKG